MLSFPFILIFFLLFLVHSGGAQDYSYSVLMAFLLVDLGDYMEFHEQIRLATLK